MNISDFTRKYFADIYSAIISIDHNAFNKVVLLIEKAKSFFSKKIWKDVRVMELFEGTSEIQKLIIGNITTGIRAFN